MIRTVEAVIDEEGNVRLPERVRPSTARRALVRILEEGPVTQVSEAALLSEEALAEDWNRPEEDELSVIGSVHGMRSKTTPHVAGRPE